MEGYQTKKNIIYETLKQEIYGGIFGFNEKLVISRLAKRFSSSEIPVREALNQLNADGLIDFKPHVGAVVNSLSREDIENIFQIRVELEGLATRLAIEHLKQEDFDEIRSIIDISYDAIEQGDFTLFEEYNLQFHMKIYGKCQNELLIKMIQDLWNNTNRYPSVFKSNIEHMKISLQEHEDIYYALINKNSTIAEEKMLKHKARAGKEILRITQQEYYESLDEVKLKKKQKISQFSLK